MNSINKSETQTKKIPPAINILKIQGGYLIVGASNGSIRFYDFQYRIIAWFEELGISRITSISFSQDPYDKNDSPRNGEEELEKPFKCPDFIVVDMECTVTYLVSELFNEVTN